MKEWTTCNLVTANVSPKTWMATSDMCFLQLAMQLLHDQCDIAHGPLGIVLGYLDSCVVMKSSVRRRDALLGRNYQEEWMKSSVRRRGTRIYEPERTLMLNARCTMWICRNQYSFVGAHDTVGFFSTTPYSHLDTSAYFKLQLLPKSQVDALAVASLYRAKIVPQQQPLATFEDACKSPKKLCHRTQKTRRQQNAKLAARKLKSRARNVERTRDRDNKASPKFGQYYMVDDETLDYEDFDDFHFDCLSWDSYDSYW